MLLQLAEEATLLQLHVEALESAVDRFVGLDGYVDQKLTCLRKTVSMAQKVARTGNTELVNLPRARIVSVGDSVRQGLHAADLR